MTNLDKIDASDIMLKCGIMGRCNLDNDCDTCDLDERNMIRCIECKKKYVKYEADINGGDHLFCSAKCMSISFNSPLSSKEVKEWKLCESDKVKRKIKK